MDFNEYVKYRVANAKNFDEQGNSPLAVCNRTFLQELLKQFSSFNQAILFSVDYGELFRQIFNLFVVLSLPITYIPLLFFRTYLSRKDCKQDVMYEYDLYKEKKDG